MRQVEDRYKFAKIAHARKTLLRLGCHAKAAGRASAGG
jgi:hypothetical protein